MSSPASDFLPRFLLLDPNARRLQRPAAQVLLLAQEANREFLCGQNRSKRERLKHPFRFWRRQGAGSESSKDFTRLNSPARIASNSSATVTFTVMICSERLLQKDGRHRAAPRSAIDSSLPAGAVFANRFVDERVQLRARKCNFVGRAFSAVASFRQFRAATGRRRNMILGAGRH